MFALELVESGLKETGRWIDDSAREFRKAQRRLMRQATNLIRNEVRRRVTSTFKNRSGVLRGQIGSRVSGQGNTLQGRVFIRKRFYYAVLETGAVIKATKAAFLVFQVGEGLVRRKVRVTKQGLGGKTIRFSRATETGGSLVKVRQVTIGRHPFFEPAYEATRDPAVEIVGRAFDAFLGGRAA